MSSFAKHARSAVLWDTGFNLFRDLLQFAQMLVLARLLTPQAYGQFGFIVSVTGFLTVFSARNFIAHTLQVKDNDQAHFQDQFTAGAVLQLNVFVLTNLVALGLRWSETYAPVAPLLHVMSLSFLLDLGCEIRRRMLEREFDWKSLRVLHGIGLILSTLTAIVMAVLGAGAYALVFPGMLVTVPYIYDLLFRQRWRPTWQFSWENYRSAFQFGIARLGAGIAFSGRQLLETSVLVSVLGFGPLGFVNRAVGLSQIACGKLPMQVMTAVYPVLARLESSSGQAGKAGDLLLRFIGWVTIPIAFVLSYLSAPVIRTVYGEQWMAAVPLFGWALGWVISATLMQVASSLTLARQKAGLCTVADSVALLGTGVCLWTLLPSGVIAYFVGLICIYQLIFWGLTFVLLRENAVSPRGVLLAFVAPLVVCSVIQIVGATTARWAEWNIDTFWPAVAWGVCFLVAYVAGIRIAFAEPLSQMIKYFPGSNVFLRAVRLPV